MSQEFEFDEFRIRFEPCSLWRNGTEVQLTPKEFATLRALVEACGTPVSAKDLIAKIWNGAPSLDDSNVRHQVQSLRRKLGKGRDYIANSPGQGYRLAAAVFPYSPAPQEECVASRPAEGTAPSKPAQWLGGRRLRACVLSTLAAGAALTGLASIGGRFWPTEVQLEACRQLTRDGRPKEGIAVSDGSRVYFIEGLENKRKVAFVPIHGGNVTALDLPLVSPVLLALSPDRRSLLLLDTPAPHLYELQIDSLTLRPLRLPRGFSANLGIGSAAWDSAGRRLAVAIDDGVMVFEPGNTSDPLRLHLPGPSIVAGWSPQDRRLRMSVLDEKSDVNQWWELTGSDLNPRPLRRLSPHPNERVGAWTGDGRFFVFESGDRNQVQIWIEDEQALPPRSYPLTVDGRIWLYPQTVPSSNTILAVARQAQAQLVSLPVSGQEGGAKPAPPGLSAYELEYSRDGKWIAYTLYPEHTIWRCLDRRQRSPSVEPSRPGSAPAALVPRWHPHRVHGKGEGQPGATLSRPEFGRRPR